MSGAAFILRTTTTTTRTLSGAVWCRVYLYVCMPMGGSFERAQGAVVVVIARRAYERTSSRFVYGAYARMQSACFVCVPVCLCVDACV